MDISEGNEKLYAGVGDYFESNGFFPNKKKDRYIRRRNGLIDTFCIRLSKKKGDGRLWHHLTLDFLNEEIDRLFSTVEDKTRLSFGLNKIPQKRATCSVTDWKSLYAKAGLSFDQLWFIAFDRLFQNDKVVDGYRFMIDAGVNWFDKINSTKDLLAHCLEARDTHSFEIYLTTIKIRIPNDLSTAYERIAKENSEYFGWDQEEVAAFYKFLVAEPISTS
jgi:hypothetical protein